MAQRKYTPAAKGRGFNAVTVSNANIQQMSAESNRIVDGMRARRDSDLENQRRILQDMESNATYSEKARKRDFDIASTNIDTQREQQQYNAKAAQDRIREETEFGAKIFESIASYSETAAKKAQELKKKKEKEADAINVSSSIALAPLLKQSDIEYKQGENEVETALNYRDASINALRKIGGYDHEIARLRNQTAQQSVASMRISVTQSTITEYPSFRLNFINDPNKTLEINGQQVTYAAAQRDPAILAGILSEAAYAFLDSKKLLGLNPGFLNDAYIKINEINQSSLTVATNNATKDFNDDTIRFAKNKAFGNFAEYGAAYFNTVNNIYGPTKAHEDLNKLALIQNTDGTFVVDENDYLNLDVNFTKDKNGKVVRKGFKGTYKEDHAFNTIATLNARETLRRQWATDQRTTERNNYEAEAAAWFQEYQNNPTRETLAAAEESFKDNQQGNPEWLTNAKAALDPLNGEYIQQLKTTAKDHLARKIIAQPLIDEIFKYDPTYANELQKGYDEIRDPLKLEPVKKNYEGVGKLVERKSAAIQFPSRDANAEHASRFLQKQWLELYQDKATEYGGTEAGKIRASREARKEIEDRILKAKKNADTTSPYYSTYNVSTGLNQFPNIPDEKLTVTEKERESNRNFDKAMDNGGQQTLINTPFAIMSKEEIIGLGNILSKPNPTIPYKLLRASDGYPGGWLGLFNKMRVRDVGLAPIKPPESLARVGEYSPSAQKLLQRFLNANVTTRIHGYEGNKLGTEWRRHVAPAEYRDIIDRHSKTYGVPPALIAAGLEVESGFRNQTSSAGAKGIAQFMAATAAQYGVNVNDPDSSIKGMTAYMKDLIDQFGDPIIAAGAYNAGPGRMQEHVQNGRPLPAETVNHMRKVTKALYKYSGDPRLLQRPEVQRSLPQNLGLSRSFTGALTYKNNQQLYKNVGLFFKDTLKANVREHSDFDPVDPVHAPNSYHKFNEAFDINFGGNIERTRRAKEKVRALGLFKEVIGPGDGDPNHETHLHLGGLMRPMTQEDMIELKSLLN